MKKLLPYVLITLFFFVSLFVWNKHIFSYKFDVNIVSDYLRSQDIEDTEEKIHDRIFVSDNDIYLGAGYLYAKGENPIKYNFQHPPLVKYLFGFSILLAGNPFYVQIFFGFIFLILTYFLGTKIFKKQYLALVPVGLLLIDPVFRSMMGGAFLDLGQAVFALLFVILALFYPKKYILQGITLGLFAASKFWSTAIIIVGLVYLFKILIKEKIDFKKTLIGFVIAFITFSTIYIKTFIDSNWTFNIFTFLAKDLKFMLAHNSAGHIGGSILLFVTGFFSPWWKAGVERATDWSILWPISLVSSTILALKLKFKGVGSFLCLLPFAYLLLTSTGVPFTRYFLIVLPFIYMGLTKLIISCLPKR